ncbi:MAG TPA: metallophosphoesterase [Chthoniobacteraceae bacterium]|jgi:3',5'-cyclic AMP phosphodiesterase CpdA|nr:metallophosphoesterase [Chthoniobacteraceae bacterium]
MRILAHLSDIHFGAIDLHLAAVVQEHLAELRPDITVISGDLTQRARDRQFRDARTFLDTLPGRQLVVPGNHDVPLWNVYARFFAPLKGYRRHITQDFMPTLLDEEVAVIGINTARSFTQKNGRIGREQADEAAAWLRTIDPSVIKIVVTHHPFDLAETMGKRHLVGRAKMALERLAAAGASVLLAGHFHKAYTGGTAYRYSLGGYSALVVQAGTATSTRLRGTPNSFNILRIDPPRVTVELLEWDRHVRRFLVKETKEYLHEPATGFAKIGEARA